MKNYKHIHFIWLFVFGFSIITYAQQLTGTVRDKDNNELLPGATIYISDLRTGCVTDLDGKYKLTNLPKRKMIIQVKLLGYSTISKTVDTDSITEMDFFLTMTAIEKKEVVVTGSAFTTDVRKTSVAVTPVDKLKIISSASDNLMQSLASTPGISIIGTGNAISKPVIRGLGFNRIVVVNEGIRQEGQQWGNEHGIEIDQFAADRIEILKGPSSLLFGSDALGGVINILEPILPLEGKIRAEVNSQYSSNNGLYANSIMTEGNLKGFTWRGRGTYKNAGSYRTPDEIIYNSAYTEKAADFLVGLHKSWGYSHIHVSTWSNKIGITEGERDSLTGKFTDEDGEIVSKEELKSRKLKTPFQNVEHTKISMINSMIIKKSQLRINLGAQKNVREEFSLTSDQPELSLQLNTLNYDVKYFLPEKNKFETVFGISGMQQHNENKGTSFLIPEYDLFDIGIFSSIKKSYTKTTLNLGMRYDTRNINGHELSIDSIQLFKSFDLNFSNISASAGITHQFSDRLNVKANLGRGFRAPNIPELSSNGIHEGTQRFESGNSKLKSETSFQVDLGILYESKTIEASLNLFQNHIDNFIYSRNIDNAVKNVDGTDYDLYQYVQGQSTLRGGEFTLDIHPVKHLHIENNLSYVHGQNEALDQPLPFIPPLKITNEIKYEFMNKSRKRFHDSYFKLEVVSTGSQKRIDVFETITKGYSILNIGLGTNVSIEKQVAIVYINVSNVFDQNYYDHLSRMKEINVHGVGRNISFGMLIPIGIK